MIGVLTSGVALGVHVPGLLLAQRMRERGARVEIFVLERLLPDSKRATTAQMKYAFHRDFRVALAGQGLAVDPSAAVPEAKVRELAEHWRRHGLRRLVLFSGFWLPVVERCAAFSGNWLEVDICHVELGAVAFLPRCRSGSIASTAGMAGGRGAFVPAEHHSCQYQTAAALDRTGAATARARRRLGYGHLPPASE